MVRNNSNEPRAIDVHSGVESASDTPAGVVDNCREPDGTKLASSAVSSGEEGARRMHLAGGSSRRRVEGVVPDYQARRLSGLGRLTDAEPDTMTLHTRDAYRAFTGRRADAAGKQPFIPGGQRYAATLKVIWYLSANDNPYADWVLIRTYDELKALRNQLSEVIKLRTEAIELLGRRGLAVSIMSADGPRVVSLSFRSPYGYATAELIVEFDYFARVVKTLIHKDQLSDAEGHAAIFEMERKMRALFHMPIQWERRLLREDLLPLRREDFLSGADDAARARAKAAVEAFGEMPHRVLAGLDTPRHTLRRVRFNQEQLSLLKEVQLGATRDSGSEEVGLL